jgi:integrase
MGKMLTAAAVRAVKPGAKRLEIPDGGAVGLHLVVQPSGVKSWALRFRGVGGKPVKMTLGRLHLGEELAGAPVVGSPLTLAGARRLAAEINQQRASHRDVVGEAQAAKRKAKVEREDAAANSFEAAARRYVESQKKRTRRWQYEARFLGLQPVGSGLEVIRKGLCDRWGSRPIAGITPAEVHGAIKETLRLGVPGLARHRTGESEAMARQMFAYLSGLFGWLVRNMDLDKNPVANVGRPPPGKPRERVLSDEEIRLFWSATAEIGEPFGPLLQILLLTGQRLREISNMERGELGSDDHGRPVLRLPGTRTKNRKSHAVPLSPTVAALLDGLHRISPKYVFSLSGSSPVRVGTDVKRRIDKEMAALAGAPIPHWTLHDIRRSVASGLARLGVRLEVTEKILNHASGSFAGIVGVYQRHSFHEEMRQALDAWALHVQRLVSGEGGGNVVPIKKAAK